MPNELLERQIINEIIHNWAIWRDTGNWKKFRSLWHDDGYMSATMFQGPIDEFIDQAKKSHQSGVTVQHIMGGSSIDINKKRATAQTRATIGQRAIIHDVLCDVICTIRFCDLFEKRNNKWGLVWRKGIYEKDRLDPVDNTKSISLDTNLLNMFPDGYRHLAYLQSTNGLTVKKDMPGINGPEVEEVYTKIESWIS
jgi:hypothetical protein